MLDVLCQQVLCCRLNPRKKVAGKGGQQRKKRPGLSNSGQLHGVVEHRDRPMGITQIFQSAKFGTQNFCLVKITGVNGLQHLG